jgi:hypothetical protein
MVTAFLTRGAAGWIGARRKIERKIDREFDIYQSLEILTGSPTKQARGLSSPEGTSHQKRAKLKEGWSGLKGVSAPVELEEELEELEESENEDE